MKPAITIGTFARSALCATLTSAEAPPTMTTSSSCRGNQWHRDPLWATRLAEAYRGQKATIIAGGGGGAVTGQRNGELSEQARTGVVGGGHRRWRSGQRRRGRASEACLRQGRRIARKSARAEARAAHRRTRQADEATQRLEPKLSLVQSATSRRAATGPPKASSFDRVVEDTLKAQIKR